MRNERNQLQSIHRRRVGLRWQTASEHIRRKGADSAGIAKYGQTLLADDGRDTPTEVVNELLDALAYVTKWAMQEPANQNVREYHRQIQVMLADMVDYINMIRQMEKYL